jgi:hypothetical protein
MAEPTQTSALESFSKFTGLPVKEVAKPKDALASFSEFVGQTIEPRPETMPYKLSGLDLAARDINLSNIYTDPIANYASYGVPLSPYADWTEIRAQNQGVGEKLGRGALKMLSTTGGAIVENTVGIIGGIGSMISGGTYADNPVGRSVDNMNEWMSENLPHYYTKAELDPERSAISSLGSANFWTDKFANGLGYSLGSLATAWLTGGAGMLGRTANVAGKALATAGRAGQVGKLVSTGEAMKNIYAASKMMATGTKLTTDLAKYGNIARTLNAAKYLEVGAMMSLAESSVEAREKSKMYVQEKEEEWLQNNPGMSINDMPASDREAIDKEARSVENFTFGWNMPILMATNLLQFGNMAMGIKTGTKAVEKTVVDAAGKRAADIPKTAVTRFLSRANKYTAPVYKNALTEAFQEGAQYMIGETAIDYYKNKFDSGVDDLTSSAIKGLSNTFGSADGVESMLLGALTGGAMGAASTTMGSAAKQRNMIKANTEKLLAITNSETFLNLQKNIEQKKELMQFAVALKAATALGNTKLANELRKNFMAQNAIMFDNLDALDLAFEKLDDMAKMPEADFATLNEFNPAIPIVDQTGGKTQQMLVEDWKKEMQKYADMGRKLDGIIQFMGPNKSGFAKLVMSKEEKVKQAAQDLYNQRLKNILLTSMIGMDTRDEEIDQAFDKLTSLSPALQNFNRNKIVTLIKRNQVSVDAQGNLVFPKSLVDTTISDVEEQKKREGEEKPDPTTDEATKKKNVKENENLTGILKTAVEESEALNKIDKMDFDKALADFVNGIYTRELASTAFDELLKSPEKREITLAAKEAAEKQAKVVKSNKEAEALIETADSTKQLDDLIDHDNLSPDMKAKVKKKYRELKAIEDKYVKDYKDLPLDVLQDLAKDIDSIEEESPAMAAALMSVLNAKLNETNEQKENKDGDLTAEQLKAKAEAEEALKKGNSEKAQSKADPDLNEKVYENQIALLSTDGRQIRVNGTVYNNLNENPLDAITREEATPTEQVIEVKLPPIEVIREEPTTDAKADIERRRQEELKSVPTGSAAMVRYVVDGNNADLTEEETNAAEEIIQAFIQNGEKNVEKVVSYLQRQGFVRAVYVSMGGQAAYIKARLEGTITTPVNGKVTGDINAKYDAELTALGQPTEEEPGVAKVTLTNEQQQVVEFTGIQALEIAEFIVMAYASQGSIESINMSEPALKKAIQDRLDALENIKKVIDTSSEYNPATVTQIALSKIMNKYRTHLSDILSVYNMAKEKYMRQGKTLADLNQDEDFKRARTMYSATHAKLKEVTTEFHKRAAIPATAPVTEDTGGQMSTEAEKDMQDKIGEAKLYIETADETITLLDKQVKALEASIKLGMSNPNDEEKLEKLKKDLDVARAEREIYQSTYNSLVDQYGHNKSSQPSKDVQDSQGAAQLAQEQGSGTTNQAAVQVSESQQVDVNDIEDAPLLPEIIVSQDFIERTEEGQNDVLNSTDYEDDQEEDSTESDPEEDEAPILRVKPASTEGDKQEENRMDIAVIKTQHQYTNGFDNILVDEDGKPVPNTGYNGTEEKDFKDGRKQFEKKNGKDVEIKIFPELLADHKLIPLGSRIFFEVRDDTVWFENSDTDPNEAWKNVPIFVIAETTEKDGNGNPIEVRVGILEAFSEKNPNKNKDREEILKTWESGKRPGTTLTNKYVDSQNIANAMTDDNQIFFYDPVPVDQKGNILHTPTLLIAIPTMKEPKWEVVLEGDVLEKGETIPADLASRASGQTLGTVAILVRTPNGELTYLRATTKPMTEVGYNAVVEAIKEGRAKDADEIVGFNKIAQLAIDDKNRDMLFLEVLGKDPETSPRAYTFWLPSAETYIRINEDELALALEENNDFFKFSFVNAVEEEGGLTKFESDPDRKDWTTHMGGVAKAFKAAIMRRRYQVSAELLLDNSEYTSKVSGLTYNSYLEYLTHPDEISDMNKDQGHSGILSSDVYLNPKTFSPYFNIVMNFGDATVNGEKVEDDTQVSQPVAKAKIVKKEPVVEEEEDYSDESDMDDEDTDVDTTNALLDDDEIAEAEETEEEDEVETEDTDANSSSLNKQIARRKKQTPQTEEDTEEQKIVVGKNKKNEGLSGKVAQAETEKRDPVVEILNSIEANDLEKDSDGNIVMYKDPVTGEETHYLIKGEMYERVTSKTSPPFTGDAQLQKNSSNAGKAVHSIAENLLTNKPYSKPANMSAVAFLQLKTQLEAIKKLIGDKSQTVIAVEMVVYKEELGLAGKFDILTRDRKGAYYLYDIKTGKETTLSNYEEEQYGAPSKRQQHGSQLSAYAYMLKGHAMDNNVEVKIGGGSVLFIPISYDVDGKIDKVGKFAEKKFTLNLNINKVLAGEVDFSFKEAKTSSDPAIKNAGKKTSSSKSTGRKVINKEVEEDEEDTTSEEGGNVNVKNMASSILKAKASTSRGGAPSLGKIKALIEKAGGAINQEMFIEFVEDATDIVLTPAQAKKIQEEIVETLCK